MASNVINYGASQTQDSDEIKEMHCEQCDKHLSKYEPAKGFCLDCCVYMCGMCIMYHGRYKQHHNLKDKYTMPQDFCFEKCSVHSNELTKFYCEKCEKFACCECRKHNHTNCETIRHLPTLVQGTDQSKELTDLINDMDTISADLEETMKQLQSNLEYITSQETTEKLKITNHKDKLVTSYSKQQKDIIENFDQEMEETIAKMKRERQELIEQLSKKKRNFEIKLNNAEKDIIKKIENSKNSDQKNLDSLMKKTSTLIDELKISSGDLVQKQNLGQKCHLFIAMKTAKGNEKNLRKCVSELKTKNRINYYNIDPPRTDLTIKALENTTSLFSYEDTTRSRIDRTATFCTDIYSNRGIQSPCLLSKNTLIVTYFNDKSLFIFQSIKQHKPLFKAIDMKLKPWAITKVEDNKVAVTFPDEGVVRLITFSGKMTVTKTDDLKVGARCHGIACSNNNLIVSYVNPGKIQILDISGHVLKCFDEDSNGKPQFSCPYFLALSPNNTTIYASDYKEHTVKSLNFDGKVKAVYKDDQLEAPCQLTVDGSGTVYVCAWGSNNVHQLSYDLNKVKILLDKSDRIDTPFSVVCCQQTDKLYVGTESGNIKVFNLSLV